MQPISRQSMIRARPMGVAGKPAMQPGIEPSSGGGFGDINSALQGLRSAVGYSPPNSAGGIGGISASPVSGPPIKPVSDLPPAGPAELGSRGMSMPTVNSGGIDEIAAKEELNGKPMTSFSPPQQQVGAEMTTMPAAIRAQTPGMVGGAGGNFQPFGPGRFGGNPPPGVLARRGGGGGIMDRRQLLNNRMRNRIQQFGGGPSGGALGISGY